MSARQKNLNIGCHDQLTGEQLKEYLDEFIDWVHMSDRGTKGLGAWMAALSLWSQKKYNDLYLTDVEETSGANEGGANPGYMGQGIKKPVPRGWDQVEEDNDPSGHELNEMIN